MKKLLLHFDTDSIPSSFDAVVAYDGGADHLIQYAGINEDNCAALTEGAMYTRAAKHKKNTAIFVGGSDLDSGQKLFKAVRSRFFANFRVSVMLDSNGCNTTAAAAVALLDAHFPVKGKTAVVLAGTGPVGQRAAVMMLKRGAQNVLLSSRTLARARKACDSIAAEFGTRPTPIECGDDEQTQSALQEADMAVATGKTGVRLASRSQWSALAKLRAIADVNTRPPTGFEGIEASDYATPRDGKMVFGGLGIGALKLKLQRACIKALFDDNDRALDADAVFDIARKLTTQTGAGAKEP